MNIIDGKKLAERLRSEMAAEVSEMKKHGTEVTLAVVLVGDDPASAVYVRNKERACEKVGIRSLAFKLGSSTTQEELNTLVRELNGREDVHGILVQFPLPPHLSQTEVLSLIDPRKDVDGLTLQNLGALMAGESGHVSCTPLGIIELIKSTGTQIAGKRAVALGRSRLVGKPVAQLLLAENATVTMCHSRTQNLAEVCAEADILVVAMGREEYVSADFIKEGAVVIDVGINRTENGLKGDVDFDSASKKAGYITPVPGGVGPMTITMLLSNTIDAAKKFTAG